MRAEQVSRLIWVIIGAGVALLFAAIIVRLVRRVVAEPRVVTAPSRVSDVSESPRHPRVVAR